MKARLVPSTTATTTATAFAGCILALAIGCSSLRAVNTPLVRHDPAGGYRPDVPRSKSAPEKTIIYLAFSGGGTRAAAFAYGVLEELRATEIRDGDGTANLLGEVDTISGVSGGSFPAAYYAAFGDRIFEDFESRFLKKNVTLALLIRALLPWNFVRILGPVLSRSDLARQYYDEKIFDGATFGDLMDSQGPRLYINATDLSSGRRFTFTQDTFDVICSDLEALSLGTAVAASSAVPLLLSPITIKNHAGTCGYEPPAWVADALENRKRDPRLNEAARAYLEVTDPNGKVYFHLLDGGLSDNLGLRSATDFVSAAGSAAKALEIRGRETPDHLAFIVVNAQTDSDPTIDLSAASPGFAILMDSITGAQIRRSNFETLLLTEQLLDRWGRELSTPDHRTTTHMIHLHFNDIEDPEVRDRVKRLPTSFSLADEDVDLLRETGRRLLRESPEFQELLKHLR